MKKKASIPKSTAGEIEGTQAAGSSPASTSVLFYVRGLSLYMQMAPHSQISFEVI